MPLALGSPSSVRRMAPPMIGLLIAGFGTSNTDCPHIWRSGAEKSGKRRSSDRRSLQCRIPGVPGGDLPVVGSLASVVGLRVALALVVRRQALFNTLFPPASVLGEA